ncbi:MAG: carcinine hydrolase/isopenicillin-N N-acyltransferase family protein [Actinomycetota bacterium]|nr:carcinine hydrolase/isopenicillin-N N-acyltransferase family protein [Actinomycetota bacterium]
MSNVEVEVFEAKSDFDYGFIAGMERPLFYRKLIGAAFSILKRIDTKVAGEFLRVYRSKIDEEVRERTEERFTGLAKAIGEERGNVRTAAGVLNGLLSTQCTNFAAAPPATDDNGVYVSWNMDLAYPVRYLFGRNPLFVVKIKDRKPYVAFGVPSIMTLGVLNSDGLAMVANAVGMTDSGDGLNASELNNAAMESCSTVDEVGELYEKSPRAAFEGKTLSIMLNMNSIWGDAAGGIAAMEYSHNYFAFEKGERGIIAEANHHQYLDRELTGGVDPNKQWAIAGSYARLGRMWELLEEYYGGINPSTARRITSDHGTNYSLLEPFGIKREWYEGPIDDGTICAHYWNAWSYLKKGKIVDALTILTTSCTVCQILISPRSLSVFFCYGWPCKNPHVPMYFGDFLESTPREPALAEGIPAPSVKVRSRSRRPYVATFGWPPEEKKKELFTKFRSGVESIDRVMDARVR